MKKLVIMSDNHGMDIMMEYIKKLINEMPISEIRKEFYITILQKRYELLKKMCEQN